MRTEPIFDTYNLVKRISKAGLKEDVAQEIVHAISESRSFDIANLATKSDLNALKQEMKAEINQVKYDILKWMIPLMMTIIALIISNKFY